MVKKWKCERFAELSFGITLVSTLALVPNHILLSDGSLVTQTTPLESAVVLKDVKKIIRGVDGTASGLVWKVLVLVSVL